MKVWNFYHTRQVPLKRKYLINWNKPSRSKTQNKFKELIRPYWKYYQVYEEMAIPSSLYRLDFFCENLGLVVEVSPESHHGNYNKFFHRNRMGYLASIKRDFKKIEWVEKQGFKLLELIDEDLDNFSHDYIQKKFNISIL